MTTTTTTTAAEEEGRKKKEGWMRVELGWRRCGDGMEEVRRRRGGEAEEGWRRGGGGVEKEDDQSNCTKEMRMVSRVTRKSPYGTYIRRNILFDNHAITAVN